MAGDWIPVRVDIADDPAVILMAGILKTDEFSVVGRLHHLWAWANRQLEAGNAPGVTLSWIDRFVGVTGFAMAMLRAGWLVQTGGGIEFPNFDRWNSKSAKRRLLTAQRVKSHRNAQCNASSVTNSLPEKRREEKSKEETPLPPETGGGERDDPDIVDIDLWDEFVAAWVKAKLPGWDKGIQRTSYRVGYLQTRLAADAWRHQWRTAIERAGKSVRCRQGSGDWNGLQLDTFLKDADILVRIIEGQFDDAQTNGMRQDKAGERKSRVSAALDRALAPKVQPE